jgi:hypothetical protein
MAIQHTPKAVFDPTKKDHMVAFTCMVSLGRQHPTLRFKLEAPHTDVRSMMIARVAEHVASKHVPKAKSLFESEKMAA